MSGLSLPVFTSLLVRMVLKYSLMPKRSKALSAKFLSVAVAMHIFTFLILNLQRLQIFRYAGFKRDFITVKIGNQRFNFPNDCLFIFVQSVGRSKNVVRLVARLIVFNASCRSGAGCTFF